MTKKTKDKNILKERFDRGHPGKRLLAIQLNGFNHTIFFDSGTRDSGVEVIRFSNYAPENNKLVPLTGMFDGYPNHSYQGSPVEFLYVRQEDR